MNQNIKNLVRIFSETLQIIEPVYEFGSYQVAGQERFDLRPLFKRKEYIGCDFRAGPGVDRIIDVQDCKEIADKSVGTIICCDTFEHVARPWLAAEQFIRILKTRGLGLVVAPMKHEIHNHPDDYWRFTPEAMRVLFGGFDNCFCGAAGAPEFPHTVFCVFGNGELNAEFLSGVDKWITQQKREWPGLVRKFIREWL